MGTATSKIIIILWALELVKSSLFFISQVWTDLGKKLVGVQRTRRLNEMDCAKIHFHKTYEIHK